MTKRIINFTFVRMDDIKMVDLTGQYLRLKKEIDASIQSVLDSGIFIKGPEVSAFAGRLGRFLDVEHVIPCANGTDALQIALMALDLNPGDEVITTPFTFIATVEVIALLGLKPVFVDIDAATFNMDPEKLEAAITDRTRAIIPVHLFGQSAAMSKIIEVADSHGIPIIEDAAQAIGAEYKGSSWQKCGTMGTMGTFSFFPSKNLGAYGDGGAICTNDPDLARKMKLIANHGSKDKYYYETVGMNSRLDAIQAAILNAKLDHLEDFIRRRIVAADRYDRFLADCPSVALPSRDENARHVFHQYTIKVLENRDGMKDALAKRHIPSAVYYPKPLHTQKAYLAYGYNAGDFPIAEKSCDLVLSLPMHTELTEAQQAFIAENIIVLSKSIE